jgi:hypothetical protein
MVAGVNRKGNGVCDLTVPRRRRLAYRRALAPMESGA